MTGQDMTGQDKTKQLLCATIRDRESNTTCNVATTKAISSEIHSKNIY